MSKPSTAQVNRLILIDGANFIHCFQALDSEWCETFEKRPTAFHLAGFVYHFVKHGFVVRVVISRYHMTPQRTNHEYVLHEMEKAGILLHPDDNSVEADDRYLLKLAEQYGAIIFSNDQYRNHRQHSSVAINNTFGYRYKPNKIKPSQLFKDFPLPFQFDVAAKLHDLYVKMDHVDYNKALEAMNVFLPPTTQELKKLERLVLYQQCDFCAKFGFIMPPQAPFIKREIEPFPSCFREFETMAHRYEREKQ